MSKQSYRPVRADAARNNLSKRVHDHASEAGPISQREAPSSGETRWQRIQIAAYHRFEVRHYQPGHDVEDWLAAEAEVGAPSAT